MLTRQISSPLHVSQALMTGRMPYHFGYYRNPSDEGGVPLEYKLLPQVLAASPAKYISHAVGKVCMVFFVWRLPDHWRRTHLCCPSGSAVAPWFQDEESHSNIQRIRFMDGILPLGRRLFLTRVPSSVQGRNCMPGHRLQRQCW